MADVTPARSNLLVEEVSYRSAVSEALLTKTGGAVNFINDRQHLLYQFNINGPYTAGGGQTGIDGGFGCLFDIEITGMMVFSLVAGSGGTTAMDIHRFTSSGTDTGTIFSTPPSITSAAGNNAYAIRDLVTPQDFTATGITLPSFNVTDLDAGDFLRFDLDTAMTGDPENCGLVLYYRPR